MTEETQTNVEDQVVESTEVNESSADELTMLKARASMMGINFSNNISVATLRKKIEAKMAGEPDSSEAEAQPNGLEEAAKLADAKIAAPVSAEKPKSLYESQYAEQMKLVRCRILCLNPNKANLPGEIHTVANRVLGAVKKFIPYGELTDEGYHIPYILYKHLEDKRFLHIRTTKDRKTGTPQIHTSWAKEFAIEVLPPLTEEELKQLASAQIAAGSVEGSNSLD